MPLSEAYHSDTPGPAAGPAPALRAGRNPQVPGRVRVAIITTDRLTVTRQAALGRGQPGGAMAGSLLTVTEALARGLGVHSRPAASDSEYSYSNFKAETGFVSKRQIYHGPGRGPDGQIHDLEKNLKYNS